MPQTYTHPESAFSLKLPDHWEHSVRNTTVAFFQPETGVGAVTVSAWIPPKGTVDPAEIVKEFAPEAIRPALEPIDLESPVPGSYVAYEFGESAWRVWAFCGRTWVLVVSYNCQVSSKGAEDAIVNEMVQSMAVD